MNNNVISNIVEFNQRILGIPQRDIGMIGAEEATITLKCLREEAQEFSDAVDNHDVIMAIDSLVDSLYFAVGALYKFGLTDEKIEQCINAVHAANMEKKLGVNARRDTGAADAVKPDGWVSPENRIASILGDTWL